jgi:redox-sensitive bicupin YhaK (pirin superfamily)
VRRLFPFSTDTLVADPFVLWDDFSIGADAGFPTHAHRGFEAITYLFDGAMNHADNLGNNSTVTAGGAQRFTAGKGISHSEMPGGTETTKGIQLWINLPQALKGIDPAYQQVDAADIPVLTQDGISIRQIVGAQSPLQLKTSVEYDDITMPASSAYTRSVNTGMQGVLYLHTGTVTVDGEALTPGQAALIKDRHQFSIQASEDSRIMLALGQAHHEPVKLTGGFVD